jgi:uncharacterized small protein (DUF1192 family)
MKHHEREFFISTIRSGKVRIKYKDIVLQIIPPTFDIISESCEIYNEAYDKSYVDGVMDEDENFMFMIEHELWSFEEEEKIKALQKDIERLKVEIYNARNNEKLKKTIRAYIRGGEKQLNELNHKKNIYFSNTCEGIATSEKNSHIIKHTTYKDNNLYDFFDLSLSYIMDEYHQSFLSENQCRELARNEPWKSLWIIRDKCNVKLFNNPVDTDLTYNQKNLVIWSQMYDNIQESLDCPTKDVIDDDDMLDGWFIIQSKKRDKEKADKEFEESVKSDKIKNSSEVFVMASSDKDVDRIDSMNNIHGQMIKKQRSAIIQKRGSVEQQYFPDEQLKLRSIETNQFKDKFKGGR